MRIRRSQLALICTAIIITCIVAFTPRRHRSTADATVHSAVRGWWFPNLYTRLRYGAPDVWRSPDKNSSNSAVIHPVANRTFLMLKTGADVMWERLPIHLETTLKRFPHHQIYSDASAQIGDEIVVDIISALPQNLISDIQLESYRDIRTQYDEAWGWSANDIKKTELGAGWSIDKFKNIPMILHAYRNAPKHCDWFVFADDDTYIHSSSLGSLLSTLNPKKKHYIGSRALIEGGFADSGKVGSARKAKAQAKDPEAQTGLVFAHGGSGVIVSRGALDALFWDPQREDDTIDKYSELAIHICCGDAMFGYMLREELELDINSLVSKEDIRIDPFWGENTGVTRVSVTAGGWCSRIIAWHHLAPHEIQQFYDWEESLAERKSNMEMGVLYSDVYMDFILPFIRPVMDYWKIDATTETYELSTEELVLEDGTLFTPNESPELCRKACELLDECLGWMFQYKSKNNSCTLEHETVNRGTIVHPFKGNVPTEEVAVSGWITDRIRQRRAREICDWLEFDESIGAYNDEPNEQEGWYFRALLPEQQGRTDLPVYEIEQESSPGWH